MEQEQENGLEQEEAGRTESLACYFVLTVTLCSKKVKNRFFDNL
jgi:hypothetical protein